MHAPLIVDDQAPAIPSADDAVSQMLDAAKISTEQELLDAIEHRRTQIGLSLASLDQLSGLTVGHASKVLSPARIKSPSTRTLYRLLDAVGLAIVLVVDGARVERMQPQWTRRDERKVRVRPLSPVVLRRARPTILAELARRASRPRWASVPAREFMQALVREDVP